MDKDENIIVFGIHPVLECIRSGKEIDRILVSTEIQPATVQEILKAARDLGIPVQKVPTEKINRVTRKNHQGVLAYVSSVEYASLDNVVQTCFETGVTPLILMLDRITDVRNFGAIARSAECLGVHCIVIPMKGAAQITADAMKTSAGALRHIPVARVNSLKETAKYLQQCGLTLTGCTEKATKNIYEVDFNGPCCVIMGSEEDGINSELMKLCDDLALIPMTGHVESLNVSVSAGVILYEAIRQRKNQS